MPPPCMTPTRTSRERRTFFGVASEEEGWCRQVMIWMEAKVRIEQSPVQAKTFVQRLEGELRDHIQAHDNCVVLPE